MLTQALLVFLYNVDSLMTGWFTTAFVEDGTFRFKSINYPQYLYTIFGHTIVELLYDLDITGLMQVVYIVMVNPGNQMDCNLKI